MTAPRSSLGEGSYLGERRGLEGRNPEREEGPAASPVQVRVMARMLVTRATLGLSYAHLYLLKNRGKPVPFPSPNGSREGGPGRLATL